MYSKKKKSEPKKGGGKALMQQMGIFPEMLGVEGEGMEMEDDHDSDLEAELLALQGDSPSKPKAKKKMANLNELDKMIAESMRDIGSDEELSEGDEADLLAELQGLGTDSPPPSPPTKVAAPVAQPSQPSPSRGSQLGLLEDRLQMYMAAEAQAKAAGDSSKARRLNRGIKTLQDLVRKAKAGKVVDEDDIPPPVSTGASKPSSQKTTPEEEKPPPPVFQPTISAPEPVPRQPSPKLVPRLAPRPSLLREAERVTQPPVPAAKPTPPQSLNTQPPPSTQPPTNTLQGADVEKHSLLAARRDQYKTAALNAKHAGDNGTAIKYIKIAKQFEQVIEALENGQPIDLANMPPPPPTQQGTTVSVMSQGGPPPLKAVSPAAPPTAAVERSRLQGAAKTPSPEEIDVPELSDEGKKKLFNAPESAGSALEALQQRFSKYKTSQQEADQEGNSSKARRMGRIVKQYESAIKSFKAGRAVDFEELPCPPGFPPIPTSSSPVRAPPAAAAPAAASRVPAPTAQVAGAPGPAAAAPVRRPAPAGPPPVQNRPKVQRQLSTMSRAEQQSIFLQERQLQFKKAALEAKRNGDMELAKKYIRFAKGFDQMIDASGNGLPVDMSQIPPPPNSSQEDFEFVEAGECTGDREQMYKKLEQELIAQIKTCTASTDNFTHLGDVSSATKFDRMGQNSRKDLDALRNAYKHGDPVPRFHYENRQFSMVKCCTDLGDNDLEITVLRGVNYGLPSGYSAKDMDTYVKYEFPYPAEDPQSGQTDHCKHTSSPEYDQSFKVQINRKSRSFLRLLRSNKVIKLDVYYRRGMLKSDKLLGGVSVKLVGLENKCEIHESSDLLDGRKTCGGKLEFKLRVRDAFVSKEVEETKEKWLVIENFERNIKPQPQQQQVRQKGQAPPPPSTKSSAAPPPPASTSYQSMEVLKYEQKLLDQQIRKYQGRLTKSEEDSLRHKGELLNRAIEDTKRKLSAGGTPAWFAYVAAIEKAQNSYVQEARSLHQRGDKDKAQIAINKKNILSKEAEVIRARLSGK